MKNDMYSLIHLPDLLFSQWCDEEFGINRGIYNTIDSWFYEKGVIEITKRRTYALNFFLSLNQHKVKFGHGGLSTRLNYFWERSIEINAKYKMERVI